jgi:LAO/AO transport system kinase
MGRFVVGGFKRMRLVKQMLSGEALSLARLISLVEEESNELPQIMKTIYPCLGKAYRVGITGVPGGGKSTIVDKMTALMRQQGFKVGIIAVDPTSAFTGGAVLGDRIRMQQHYLDDGVFIRSMASRGSLGGLPQNTSGVIKLLDAFGADFILVETVGVGQTELDVMKAVDTVVLVVVPESGDTIQTMKAGIFEIADIFVVNKADRPGADNCVAMLETMIHLHAKQNQWQIPVVATQAINDVGIEHLYQQIVEHRQFLSDTGQLFCKRQQQRREEFIELVRGKITAELLKTIEQDGQLNNYVDKVEKGEIDPYSATDEVLQSRNLLTTLSQRLSAEKLA